MRAIHAKSVLLTALVCSMALFAAPDLANAQKKPKDITFLSDGETTAGYAHAMAISATLNKFTGIRTRVLPNNNGLSRIKALMAGDADFCLCNANGYIAQEGLLGFGRPTAGPQPVRLVLTSLSSFSFGMAMATDTRAKKLEDMRLKRFPWIRGADQMNMITTAFLAYAGLRWTDVQKMTFPGYEEALIGFNKNQVDAILISNSAGSNDLLNNSKRKFFYANLDPSNRKGWKDMAKIAPYFEPSSSGAWNGVTHPYPVLLTSNQQDTDSVYNFIKTMNSNLDNISTILPQAENWHPNWQNLKWVIPFHDGAIKYFEELGIWTEAAQNRQIELLKRQSSLRAAFKGFMAENPDPDNFASDWQLRRYNVLSSEELE